MTTYIDATLNDEQGIRNLVKQQQVKFQKMRGSSALALMVAHAYIDIRKTLANADADTQAAILDEHGVAPATGYTSQFTPWIKVYWGEPDLEGKTFKDGNGDERTVWVPDRSMEIYHHTMEELLERGVETTDAKKVADVIMKSGGSAKMAKVRKAALAKAEREAAAPVSENKRRVFLSETQGALADLPIERPKDSGEFMTVLVRAVPDQAGYEVLGIVNANAVRELDQLADDQFDAIQARIKARREDAERLKRDERIREEERNRVIGGLDPEARRQLIERLAAAATDAFGTRDAAPANEQSA